MTDVYRAMPVLPARQVEKTAAFYRGVLGFEVQGLFRDGEGPAFFVIIGRDQVTIGLEAMAHFTPHEGVVAYLYVADAQATATAIRQAGDALRHPSHETFYGCLEFDLVDPEGHVIAFGQDLNPGPDGPGF